MKYTVLDIVQAALRTIKSDAVNSISDTDEATDIAYIVRDVYLELMASRPDWEHLQEAVSFTGLGNTSRPTHMEMDTDLELVNVDSVYYDKRAAASDPPLYQRVYYLTPEEFLRKSTSRSSDSGNTTTLEVTDDSGIKLYVRTDAAPMYFTSFDDEKIVFDAYDSDVDTTLQGSKTQATGAKTPSFTVSDSHTPDLPEKWFPYLVAEVKSVVAIEIGEEANPKEEQRARRARASASRKAKAHETAFTARPNYGRHV